MRILSLGREWNARSAVVRVTFLTPVAGTWLFFLLPHPSRALDGAGLLTVTVVVLAAVAWAAFVCWRVQMNELRAANRRPDHRRPVASD